MIQFNLLPDVKLEYIKARRTKRLVVLASVAVAGASIAVTVILFIGTNVLQRRHLNNLGEDIEQHSHELENEKDLDKILTVQNQLNVLDELHNQKPAAARMGTYLSQIVPEDVAITELQANYVDHTMTIDGSAAALSAVNKFIDTLKFTTFKAGDQKGSAFSDVVLASFDRSDEQAQSSGTPATYQITLSFDPIIFGIEQEAQLEVPQTTTTRSAIESPASPFEATENGEGH